MDINVTAICVTIIVGVIAIGLAIYLGLRGFSNSVSKKVDETRNSIVLELSGIKENIVKIITRVDDVWQLVSVLMRGQAGGTIELELKNFGKTKVSAEMAEKETRYIIRPEKSRLIAETIIKMSKVTHLARTELEMFSDEPLMVNAGGMLIVTIPSVDPELCTKYMSYLLKWLDTEYVKGVESEIAKFEKDIKV